MCILHSPLGWSYLNGTKFNTLMVCTQNKIMSLTLSVCAFIFRSADIFYIAMFHTV